MSTICKPIFWHILLTKTGFEKPPFPFLAMTISGGHTQIVKVNHYFDMEVIGETIDDAVGEAFDKSGKILGLRLSCWSRNRQTC